MIHFWIVFTNKNKNYLSKQSTIIDRMIFARNINLIDFDYLMASIIPVEKVALFVTDSLVDFTIPALEELEEELLS